MQHYQSAEAFCLMLYRAKESGREEWIWNSRDGVTPFGLAHAETGEDMLHVDWFRDVRAPFYVPPVGSRIFVDLTEQRARILAAQVVEKYSGDQDFKESYAGLSHDELVTVFAKGMFAGGPGTPDVLVVNDAMAAAFRARQPARQPQVGGGRFG